MTEEEKLNMPKVTKELLLRILSYLKPYWLQFLMVFGAILLSATVGLLPVIITGRIVDHASVGENLALLILPSRTNIVIIHRLSTILKAIAFWKPQGFKAVSEDDSRINFARNI